MKFLKKDINLKLAFLIIVLLLLFAGFSVYYQKNLDKINQEYKEKREELDKITAKLVSEEAKALEISQIKENAQKDKEVLEKGFNELKNENEVFKNGLSTAKYELEKTKAELQDKTDKFNLLQERFNQVEQSLVKANEEISRLTTRANELCEKLEAAGSSDEEC